MLIGGNLMEYGIKMDKHRVNTTISAFIPQVPTSNISGFKINNATKSEISDWNILL
jgi:hypothetical protein